jgi:glutamate/tyrosine decarboxylase-like PLP-dependent enzyme
MKPEDTRPAESLSLDPIDWEEFRALGHRMLDDMVEYLRTVRERPAWQSPPEETREFLRSPLPRKGAKASDVYEAFKQHILPYPTGNIHPRFWGWVMGNGTPVGLYADLLASAMNCHVSGYDQSASLVEHEVIGWLAEAVDFPKEASGLLVDGGTVANLIGVATARNTLESFEVRKEGINPQTTGLLRVYGSEATHGWAERSCDLLGLGTSGFRKVPVDASDRIRVDELARMMGEDRSRGDRPFCIIGNAGTVTTGATDDLEALVELAKSEHVWFHVDGAFGALAKLSPRHRRLVDGLEKADSLAFDLHKWGYMQYETGVVLVRNPEAHQRAFSFAPSYLETFKGGIAVKPTEFASLGVQLSRGFRALRVWMNLSVYGTDLLGALVEQNIDDSQYLARRVESEPELELLAPAPMNVVCFRYRQDGMSETETDAFNSALLVRLQESGVAVPSNARIHGRFAIRVANTNHRTTRSDFDLLIDTVLKQAHVLRG